MNRKVVIGAVVAAVVVVGGLLVSKAMRLQSEAAKWSGPVKEIIDEQVTREGKETRARYVSMIDGPSDAVLQAIWRVEDSPKTVENIKMAKVLESQGDTKVVEINLQALTLPLQNLTTQWTIDRQKKQVTFKTLKSQAQDIEALYVVEASPDGKRTRLTYTAVIRDKIALSLPQSVIDSANRETYVNTVRGVQKTVKPQG
jgi:hypothetical protein